jgi:GH15 family glucan-1,4-alpha-glucosidase
MLLSRTTKYWRNWSARCNYTGQWREPVLRSLLTLESLTFSATGGIVAAATTSLPETLAGRATGTTGTAGFATRHSRWKR